MKPANLINKNVNQYGSFIEAIKRVGFLTSVDFALFCGIDALLSPKYRPRKTQYGLSEIVFHARRVDEFERYAAVIKQITNSKTSYSSILEIGAGGEGIRLFSNLLKGYPELYSFDLDKNALATTKKIKAIVGDGCHLPFKDKFFDLIILVDALEHIPKNNRHKLFSEIIRVGKKMIVFTCPLQSNNGLFVGKQYDILFQKLFQDRHHRPEPNTAQHILAGHPTIEEIKKELPGSIIHPYKNCEVWIKYNTISHMPFAGFLGDLLYYFHWQKKKNNPPYWGAVVNYTPTEYKESYNLFKQEQ